MYVYIPHVGLVPVSEEGVGYSGAGVMDDWELQGGFGN